MALGIYYLHEFDPPVLHLDLKSANVLIDDAGIAKVCDFGMSHVLEDAAEARRMDLPSCIYCRVEYPILHIHLGARGACTSHHIPLCQT